MLSADSIALILDGGDVLHCPLLLKQGLIELSADSIALRSDGGDALHCPQMSEGLSSRDAFHIICVHFFQRQTKCLFQADEDGTNKIRFCYDKKVFVYMLTV